MTGCLYEVLGLGKDASQEEIKKAYRQRALQLHPDKNPGNEDAKAKFQLLQKVYAILGDEEKRKVYDHTGSTDDDDLAGAGFDGLVDYFRAMYGIHTEDIDDFTARYQGSADERADLLRYYDQFRGCMDVVFNHLMCSDPEFDSHRLRDVLEEAIEAGEVQRFKPYTAWAKSVAARPRPPARRRSEAGPSNALIAAIQSKRAAAADNFFDSLAAKYGGAAGKGKEKGKCGKEAAAAAVRVEEPTESEFEAARRRLVERNKGSGATSKAQGKRKGEVKAAAGGKKGSRRSRAASDDEREEEDREEGLPDVEEEDLESEDDGAASEEEEEERGAKRQGKKARRNDAGRASVGTTADEGGKSAKKQKRKSGGGQAQQPEAEEDSGEEEEEEGRAAGAGGKRPLKAKPAAGQEAAAAAAAPEERSAGKGKKGKEKKDPDARRGAEKENKAGTPATGEKVKGKDKRLSGAGGEASGGHPSKKAKRAAT